jgi:hypothetical protein
MVNGDPLVEDVAVAQGVPVVVAGGKLGSAAAARGGIAAGSLDGGRGLSGVAGAANLAHAAQFLQMGKE